MVKCRLGNALIYFSRANPQKKVTFVGIGLLVYLLIVLLTGAPLAAEDAPAPTQELNPTPAPQRDTTLQDHKDENTHGRQGEERQEEHVETQTEKDAATADFVPFKLFPRDEEVLNGVRRPRPPTPEQLAYVGCNIDPCAYFLSIHTRLLQLLARPSTTAVCQSIQLYARV